MFSEEELLPLSALQHLVFCERQCALIHIERAWVDNPFTVEGKHLHEAGGGLVARTKSPPARGRGLKPLRGSQSGRAGLSPPARGRGLKHCFSD